MAMPRRSPTTSQPGHPAVSPHLSEDEKRNEAWHYHGYPQLAKWMASSPSDLFLLRRFSVTTSRCLLSLQYQIFKYEEELHGIDATSLEEQPGLSYLDSLEHDTFTRRAEIVHELTTLLQRYFDLINSYSEVRDKPTAQREHFSNLDNFFITYPEAIRKKEQHFMRHKQDLFRMRAKPSSPLAKILDRYPRIWTMFSIKKRRPDLEAGAFTTYWSRTAFNQAICAVTVVVGLVLLFTPMWWLHYVADATSKLGIITAFVTLFAFWLWVAAGPRQFEILLGTAAYAAVLYIYLQASSGSAADSEGPALAAQSAAPVDAVAKRMLTFRA